MHANKVWGIRKLFKSNDLVIMNYIFVRKKSNIFSISRKYTKQEIEDMPEEEVNKELFSLAMSYTKEAIFNKSVWFMISEMYGKYHIVLYYDNGYNKANGEDL